MKILSFVGSHPIDLYKNCTYDSKIRKYRNGVYIGTIEFSGKVLSAVISQKIAEPLIYGHFEIETKTKPIYLNVDEIPGLDVCDYCVVSNFYAVACKELGKDTSRLLTIGGTVVDDNGIVIGACFLNRN